MIKRDFKNIIILLLLVLTFTGSTYSYFSVHKKVENIITTGSLSIKLIETDINDRPYPIEEISVLPGDDVIKKVFVMNDGAHPAWVRLNVKIKSTQLDQNQLALNFDKNDWVKSGNYYYYKHILNPQDISKPLFDNIKFNDDIDLKINDHLTIEINAEAVQSEFNGNSVFEAKGWNKF